MSNLNDDNFVYGDITLTNNTGGPYVINSDTIGASGTGYTISSGGVGYTIGAADTNYTWTTGTTGIDWSIGSSNIRPSSGKVSILGPDADIEVNGRSLMNAIDALEQRLNIMVPNPELEKEWDELKELGDRYRALEKQCKEKGEMWAKLKEIKK